MTTSSAPVLVSSVLSLVLFWPVITSAESDSSLADALGRCSELERDADRLRCYDTIARRHAEHPVPSDSSRDPGDTGVSAPKAVSSPGSTGSDRPEEESITRITRITERPRGERIFELGNGERWTEQTRERTRFRVGDAVAVQRTALGGALLVREAGGATRVRSLD